MSADFEIVTRTIKVGETGSFTVRGLSSEDVVFLTEGYLEDVKNVVASYSPKVTGGILGRDQVADLVMDIVKKFPIMSAEIISRCADARDQLEKFARLPFIKQIEALKAIAELSVVDGGIDMGKATEVLVSLLEARGLQLGPLTTQLQTIINGSANQSPTSKPTATQPPIGTR